MKIRCIQGLARLVASIAFMIPLLAACAPSTSPADMAPVCENRPVDVNTANFYLLETLPGIGPFYARLIIEYRRQHGAFTTVNDLLKIGLSQKGVDRLYFNCVIDVQ